MTVAFFDTNVLIYAYISDDQAKWRRATSVLAEGGHISVQCLNEFALVARRKLKFDWYAIEMASADIVELCSSVVPVTLDIHQRGLDLAATYRLNVYDAMIVAAALAAGCDTLWSEDMHDGLVVDGALTIRNPFA